MFVVAWSIMKSAFSSPLDSFLSILPWIPNIGLILPNVCPKQMGKNCIMKWVTKWVGVPREQNILIKIHKWTWRKTLAAGNELACLFLLLKQSLNSIMDISCHTRIGKAVLYLFAFNFQEYPYLCHLLSFIKMVLKKLWQPNFPLMTVLQHQWKQN